MLGLDLEYAHEEEVVQSLVGIVDAQLLEGVGLEDLEAEDVEQACLGAGLGLWVRVRVRV